MIKSKRLARLVPVLIIAAAGSFAMVGTQSTASAQQAPSGATGSATNSRGGDITPDDQKDQDVVGSGRENYYVPDAGGLPPVDNPGEYLYQQGCSTCHGLDGNGQAPNSSDNRGVPTLHGVGRAGIDFWVGTGRMPLSTIIKQAPRKTPIYTQDQIDAIGDYVVEAFGEGPEIPHVDLEEREVEREDGSHISTLALGNQLYASNCAQCHNSAGSGGSLGRDYNAPRLFQATPTQVAEAIRIGPGAMPQWDEKTFSDEEVDSIVQYVDHLGNESPGGLKLGATGPVPEGYFSWFIGLGLMLLFARWIGTRV